MMIMIIVDVCLYNVYIYIYIYIQYLDCFYTIEIPLFPSNLLIKQDRSICLFEYAYIHVLINSTYHSFIQYNLQYIYIYIFINKQYYLYNIFETKLVCLFLVQLLIYIYIYTI